MFLCCGYWAVLAVGWKGGGTPHDLSRSSASFPCSTYRGMQCLRQLCLPAHSRTHTFAGLASPGHSYSSFPCLKNWELEAWGTACHAFPLLPLWPFPTHMHLWNGGICFPAEQTRAFVLPVSAAWFPTASLVAPLLTYLLDG